MFHLHTYHFKNINIDIVIFSEYRIEIKILISNQLDRQMHFRVHVSTICQHFCLLVLYL